MIAHTLWKSTGDLVVTLPPGCNIHGISTNYGIALSNLCRFGQGSGQIWLNDVFCSGNESCLLSCSNNGIGVNICEHSQDVAIFCSGTRSSSTNCSFISTPGKFNCVLMHVYSVQEFQFHLVMYLWDCFWLDDSDNRIHSLAAKLCVNMAVLLIQITNSTFPRKCIINYTFETSPRVQHCMLQGTYPTHGPTLKYLIHNRLLI